MATDNRGAAESADDRLGSVPAIISPDPVSKITDPDALRDIELNRQYVAVVAAMSSLSWGQGLTPGIRRSIAEWCRRHDVDPMTELDVLGGNFYVNAEWYLRKLGELRRQGVVADFWLEHIHADARLKALIDDASTPEDIRERARRTWTDMMFKRIEHNAPEAAEAVCVAYIVLPDGGHPVKGCKWGGNGTSIKQPRRGEGTAPNPIVENNAALSVESQAIRRAVRQVASAVEQMRALERAEDELEQISERLEANREHIDKTNERLELEAKAPPRALASGEFVGYTQPRREMEAVPREAAVAEAQRAALEPDPYTGERRPAPAPGPNAVERALEGSAEPNRLGTLEVLSGPRAGETLEIFTGEAPAGAARATECGECERPIRRGHPEDHKPSCSKYGDPD